MQNRLDVMYEDRLDGRIDVSLFERKSSEYRQEQATILEKIDRYGTADGLYVEARIRLLELTRNMHRLFEKQQAAEKGRLLNFVVSSHDGQLETDLNRNWLPDMDSNHDSRLQRALSYR